MTSPLLILPRGRWSALVEITRMATVALEADTMGMNIVIDILGLLVEGDASQIDVLLVLGQASCSC